MKPTDPVMVIAVYHLKVGDEKDFLKLWYGRIQKLAYREGCESMAMYHNEETDEYVCCSSWSSRALAESFLSSTAFQEVTRQLNAFCLVPSSKENFEILRRRIA